MEYIKENSVNIGVWLGVAIYVIDIATTAKPFEVAMALVGQKEQLTEVSGTGE